MTIPLSLYIHLPWCVKKCPYCDFNSHVGNAGNDQEQQYIQALNKDIQFESLRIKDREVQTIFFGGGTPSLFSVKGISTILKLLRENFNISKQAEITMEANPGTAEADKFKGFYSAGVNRLSIGIQSFSDQKLSELGRIHNANDAEKSIELAQQAGFKNINLDLMYGLPQQSSQQALADLQLALSYRPAHISWYELTIEPNTVFYSKPPSLPDDAEVWEMHVEGKKILEHSGYMQYEVSAYGKIQCRHNLNYWQFGDYLGLGAGAHGKLTNLETQQITRFARVKSPQSYINYSGSSDVITENNIIDTSNTIFEFMLNAFRLSQGFNWSLFEQRTGLQKQCASGAMNLAEQRGWIEIQDDVIKPTLLGKQYLNEVIKLFLEVA